MRDAQMYHGAPCGRCGSRLRYQSNRKCVACERQRGRGNVSRNGGSGIGLDPLWRSTYLALFHPAQFDREGWSWPGYARTHRVWNVE